MLNDNANPVAPVIVVKDVTRLEAAELSELLGDDTRLEASPTAADYGDVTLVAVAVVVSTAALRTLGIWLAKERSRSVARQELEIRRPDGTIVRQVLELRTSAEEAIDESVIRALGDMTAGDQPALDQGEEGDPELG